MRFNIGHFGLKTNRYEKEAEKLHGRRGDRKNEEKVNRDRREEEEVCEI